MAVDFNADVAWAAKITVRPHATLRARQRLSRFDLVRWETFGLDAKIKAEVRVAIFEGRVMRRPPEFLRRPDDFRPKNARQVYAYNQEATRCWIVEQMGWNWIEVVTLLTANTSRDRHLLRESA